MIHAPLGIIAANDQGGCRNEFLCSVGRKHSSLRRRHRPVREDLRGEGTHLHPPPVGENPLPQIRPRNRRPGRGCARGAQPFVGAVEEDPVSYNRASHTAAELVPPEGRQVRGIKKVSRIQRVVAEEVVRLAVPGVAARFAHGVEHAPQGAPILGAEKAGLYLELARAPGAVHHVVWPGGSIVLVISQIGSVQQKEVVIRTPPGNIDLRPVSAVRGDSGLLELGHSGLQQNQIGKAAPVQGKFIDGCGCDQGADGGLGRVHQRRFSGYHYGLRYRSDLHLEIHDRLTSDRQHNS